MEVAFFELCQIPHRHHEPGADPCIGFVDRDKDRGQREEENDEDMKGQVGEAHGLDVGNKEKVTQGDQWDDEDGNDDENGAQGNAEELVHVPGQIDSLYPLVHEHRSEEVLGGAVGDDAVDGDAQDEYEKGGQRLLPAQRHDRHHDQIAAQKPEDPPQNDDDALDPRIREEPELDGCIIALGVFQLAQDAGELPDPDRSAEQGGERACDDCGDNEQGELLSLVPPGNGAVIHCQRKHDEVDVELEPYGEPCNQSPLRYHSPAPSVRRRSSLPERSAAG